MFVTVVGVQAFSCTCLGPSQAKTMREVAAWYLNRPDAVLIVEGKKAQIGTLMSHNWRRADIVRKVEYF
jgi:hypothetical protein